MNRRLGALGAASGVLNGLLGIGGGIIVVPGLIWAAGLDRHTASGTSLLVILPPAVVATLVYAFVPGGAFDPGASAILVVGSLLGAVIGVRANARFSERGLRVVLAVISGLFGLRLVIPFGFGEGMDTLALDAATVALLLVLGFNGGFLSGLLGVGGSAIAIALMVIVLDASQVLAQGIALPAVIPTVIVGALAHRRQGSLEPRLGLVTGLVGMAGAVPGALIAFALPVDVLRTAFGAMLVFSSARTLLAVRRGRAAA